MHRFIYTILKAAHGIAEALVCEQLTRLKARLAAQAVHTKVIFFCACNNINVSQCV